MVEFISIVTIVSIIVSVIGGIFALRNQMKEAKKEQILRDEMNQAKIIDSIRNEINPIQVDLKNKDKNITDLWKDLETLEDDLNKLQTEVARHTGVIDIQTPLIVEIRNQIDVIRGKIEIIQGGMGK